MLLLRAVDCWPCGVGKMCRPKMENWSPWTQNRLIYTFLVDLRAEDASLRTPSLLLRTNNRLSSNLPRTNYRLTKLSTNLSAENYSCLRVVDKGGRRGVAAQRNSQQTNHRTNRKRAQTFVAPARCNLSRGHRMVSVVPPHWSQSW